METDNRRPNNKLNSLQKTIMAEFMAKHPNLAQNLITMCPKGKSMSDGLWAQLTNHLNNSGPPYKDAKAWKKVFADQKYNAKKKMSYNSLLKDRSHEEYLYQQKRMTLADQKILKASGLEVIEKIAAKSQQSEKHSSRASSPVETAGTATIKVENTDSVDSILSLASSDILEKDAHISDVEQFTSTHEDSIQSFDMVNCNDDEEMTMELSNTSCDNTPKDINKESIGGGGEADESRNMNKSQNLKSQSEKENDTLKFLYEYCSNQSVFQQRIESKLDRLLDIEERMLKIKEEKHKSVIALNLIKLQIKTMELEKLKASQ